MADRQRHTEWTGEGNMLVKSTDEHMEFEYEDREVHSFSEPTESEEPTVFIVRAVQTKWRWCADRTETLSTTESPVV